MAAIVRDLSTPALAAAIEANWMAWWAYFGHAPQADVHDEPDLLWLTTGIPIPKLSVVARTRLSAATADARIGTVLAYFAVRGTGGAHWFLGPSTQPADMGSRLLAHGLAHEGEGPGMAVDLATLPETVAHPDGLVIERVGDAAQLRQWADVATAGYGEPPVVRAARIAVNTSLGWGADLPKQRYVARLDGQPVAMAELFLAAGVAGIYDVLTVPEVRGQGIGAAITLAPLLAARAMGYRAGVLLASEMGQPVYRRLGFERRCAFNLYAWTA